MDSADRDVPPGEMIANAKDLYRQWRLNEAQIILEKLLESPGKYETAALNLYSEVMWSLGDKSAAAKATSKLLDISPLDPVATRRAQWLDLNLDPARYSDEWVSEIIKASKKPSTYAMLARLLNETGYHEKALIIAQKGTRLVNKQSPDDERTKAKLLIETAMAHEHLGDESKAISILNSINPALPVAKSAALNKARLLHETGNYEEALTALSPYYDNDQIAFNTPRYHSLLSRGDFTGAFSLYKSRKETIVFKNLIENYAAPCVADIKHGDDTILILAEGGPGDELRMSSLYGDIVKVAGKPHISCDPRLETLLARSYPEANFVPSPRFRDELRKGDYSSRNEVRDSLGAKLLTNNLLRHCSKVETVSSIFEFLAELRPDRQAFRSGSNLRAEPGLVAKFADDINPQTTNIGLCWRSLVRNSTRDKHYLSVDHLELLKHIPNAEFWLLQPGATDDEISAISKFVTLRAPKIDLVDDFEAQAALIMNLDAVIAPCTTTAELSGLLGVKTYILANTHTTAWRQNVDGTDVWHQNGKLILSHPIGNKVSLITQVVKDLTGLSVEPPTAKVLHPLKPAISLKARIRQTITRIPGARQAWRFAKRSIALFAGNRPPPPQSDTQVKRLLRQKDITSQHIDEANNLVKKYPSATSIAVKAVLQHRSGKYSAALKTIANLPPHPNIKPDVLIATRTELADLGRHDLAKEGIRHLTQQNPKDEFQDKVRIGNAEFEENAWQYLSSIKQPDNPKGYVLLFPLNNRVTTGLFTPIAFELARQEYAVASIFAATMPRSKRPELTNISGAIRWAGMSLTNEPYRHRSLRNMWTVDLKERLVACDGINYFTFFADRLGKLSNSYDLNLDDPKLFAAFEGLLQRSDVALTACKRLLKLAKLGKPIRLVAMDTHFAPSGIVRQWCEEVGGKHDIELVALSISYENYYSNLTSLEARTISVENMTAHPDLRHPLFGGRERFEKFLKSHPDAPSAHDAVMTHIKVDRSQTEGRDQSSRNEVISRVSDCKAAGGRVFTALGKVLIDFAAPYDRGHTFGEFSDWIKFLAKEIAGTKNLLIIKPHPHEKRSEIAAPGVQTLRDLLPEHLPENVVFLDHADFNSFELAEIVDAAFVWNGTAYAEFPILGTPIVAESIWAERDYPVNGIQLQSEDEYREVLSGARSLSVAKETRERATAYLQFMKSPEIAIPYEYVRRAGTNQSIGSISFIPADMKNALKPGRDPNLRIVASRFFDTQR